MEELKRREVLVLRKQKLLEQVREREKIEKEEFR